MFIVSWGDVPTWVSAIALWLAAIATTFAALGTVGALFAALFQINTERQRRRADEEKGRQENHLAQARLISAILGHTGYARPELQREGQTAVDLINSSDEPVYRLVVGVVFIQGAAPHVLEEIIKAFREHPNQAAGGLPFTTASILPPRGTYRIWIERTAFGVMGGRTGIEVAFTDRAGSHWIRRAMGAIEELPAEPFEYFAQFGLYGPYDLQTPIRVE